MKDRIQARFDKLFKATVFRKEGYLTGDTLRHRADHSRVVTIHFMFWWGKKVGFSWVPYEEYDLGKELGEQEDLLYRWEKVPE